MELNTSSIEGEGGEVEGRTEEKKMYVGSGDREVGWGEEVEWRDGVGGWSGEMERWSEMERRRDGMGRWRGRMGRRRGGVETSRDGVGD